MRKANLIFGQLLKQLLIKYRITSIRATVLTSLLSLFLISHAQHPWLVKDINANTIVNQLADGTYIGQDGCGFKYPDQAPQEMYKVNSFALFFADDGKGKRGLWRSDG